MIGQWAEALDDCDEAIASSGLSDPRFFNIRGLVHLQLRQFDAAIADYDVILRFPRDADALYGRGLAKQGRGDAAEGEADMARAKEIDSGVAERFERYRVLASSAASGGDLRQHCLAGPKMGLKLDVLIKGCTAVIQSGRGTKAGLRAVSLAEAFYYRGLAYLLKREYDRAIADFGEAIRIEPDLAGAYFSRGMAFTAVGDHRQAADTYTALIGIRPNDAGAHAARAEAYRLLGESARAIADFGQALRLDPRNTEALAGRGTAFLEQNEDDSAIADYDEAIRLNPELAGAYHGRGVAYTNKSDYGRASADFAAAIRLDPDNPDVWRDRCWLRARFGYLPQALDDCKESLRLRTGDAETLDARAFVYLKMQQAQAAIGDYDAALRQALEPDARAHLLYGRGLAKRMLGDNGGAEADTAAATRLDADAASSYEGFDK
jgi:tetratricopeptide (TPR) repeat protein